MSSSTIKLVDSTAGIINFLDTLSSTTQTLAIDLEGVDLSREGTISLLQIYPQDGSTVYILDITTLGVLAFDTENHQGLNIRYILESDKFTKVFWDIRNDADALHYHYNISLAGCTDLQILELCVRRSKRVSTIYVTGLSAALKCFKVATSQSSQIKDRGNALFAPERGGSKEVDLMPS